MTYEALDFNYYNAFAIFALLSALIGIGAVLFFTRFTPSEKKQKMRTNIAMSGFALLIVGLLGFFVCMGLSIVSSEKNKAPAANNLMAKYDLKEVHWSDVKTTAEANGEAKGGGTHEILVTANNGNDYIFKYEVNRETSEPTLKNMPIQGGNTPDKSVSADALLKAGK